jgi:hypothetical protein
MIQICINNKHILYITEHGCRRKKIKRSEEKVFVIKQRHFAANDENAIAWNVLIYEPMQCDSFNW